MSPTSAGGGTNTKTGGEHISRLVETPWNNGVIIEAGKTKIYIQKTISMIY